MVTDIQHDGERGRFLITFDLGDFANNGRQLLVAGSFNSWSTSHEQKGSGFIHTGRSARLVTIELPPGYYEYKYYDEKKSEWMEIEVHPSLYHRQDVHNFKWNPFGTKNCVLNLEQ